MNRMLVGAVVLCGLTVTSAHAALVDRGGARALRLPAGGPRPGHGAYLRQTTTLAVWLRQLIGITIG
jgi:hypothetical protein